MAIEVGSAVGYLDLDINGFLEGLNEANQAAGAASQQISKTMSEKLKDAGATLQDVGGSLSKYVTLPIAGAGAALLKFGSDFETEMTKIKAITGMTAEELKVMEAGISDIAKSTGLSQSELAGSAKMVAEAGGDMNLMMEQLTNGANLAVATETDLATTLDMLGSTMKTFGLEAEDSQMVVDSLAYVTTLANTTLQDLNNAYVNAGGAAATAGLSINETNAILVELSNAGLKGGAAGTSLAGVLRNLSTPTDTAATALAELGVALYDNQGRSRDSLDVMNDLGKALDKLSEQEKAEAEAKIFDTNAMKAWTIINEAGIGTIDDLTNELEGAVDGFDGLGQAAGMASEMQNSLAAQLKSIYPYLEDLGIKLLEIVKPAIVTVVDWIKQALEWLTNLSPTIQMIIVAIAAFAAAIGPVLVAIGSLVAFVPIVLSGIAALASAVITIVGVIATGWPIILAIVAAAATIIGTIVAVGAAIVQLWQTNEEFRNKVVEVWTTLQEAFWSVVNHIRERLAEMGFEFEDFTDFVSQLWDGFVNWLLPVLNTALDAIMAAIEWFSEEFKKVIDVFLMIVEGDWEGAWETVKEIFWDVVEALKEILAPFAEWLLDWIHDRIVDLVSYAEEQAIEIGKSILMGIWNGIIAMKDWLLDKLYNFFGGIVSSVKEFLGIGSPSKVFAEQVGQWIPPGITLGFEEALPEMERDINDMLSDAVDSIDASEIGAGYVVNSGFGSGDSVSSGSGYVEGSEGAATGIGNTFIFNSPEPIDEATAARLFEQQQKQMAFGF